MNLYEIATEYKDLIANMYNEETGEINEKSLVLLDEMNVRIEDKCLNVAFSMKNIDAECEAIESALLKMDARLKRLKKRKEGSKYYLESNMKSCGISEIKCPYFTIKVKNNNPSVEVKDMELIPEKYFKTKTETTLDKVQLLSDLKALKDGDTIPGAGLKQGTRLEIK